MAGNRTEEIVELLRTKITSRQLRPGDALAREELLAQDFGVSRASVRESLGILKAQGYLVSRRGKYGGTFISTLIDSDEVDSLYRDLVLMDQMQIKEILEARLLIEPEAARRAASGQLKVPFSSHNEKSWLDSYIRFHNELGHNSHNTFYQVSIRSFMKFIATFIETLGQSENSSSICLHDQNIQNGVIDAIHQQDPALAFEKMYLYTALSKEKILNLEPQFIEAKEALFTDNPLK